jgi:hypothetical protein
VAAEPLAPPAAPDLPPRGPGGRAGRPWRRAGSITTRSSPREVRAYLGEPVAPLTPAEEALRPRTLADCDAAQHGTPGNPCPWVSCRYHLALEIRPTGSIAFCWAPDELDAMPETCALRAADRAAERGGFTLEEVGALLRVTRERARQIEYAMLAKVGDELRALLGRRAYEDVAPAAAPERTYPESGGWGAGYKGGP